MKANNTKITEIRHLYISKFHNLCMEHKWLTLKGGREAADKFFHDYPGRTTHLTTKKLQKLAEIVIKYSTPDTTEILELGGVMYCINEVCSFSFLENYEPW